MKLSGIFSASSALKTNGEACIYRMNKQRRGFCAILFAIVAAFASAQESPSVAAYTLSGDDVGEHVVATVNDLVFSFIRELRTYQIRDMRKETLPRDLGVPDGMNYIFYGSIQGQSDGIKLELILKGGPFQITRIISRVFDNTNRILLESRMLVRDLFDLTIQLPEPPQLPENLSVLSEQKSPSSTKVVTLDSLAGTWTGERGVEKILILRGGRGMVVLSSGISLSVELGISGNELIVKQKSGVTSRQFLDLNDAVAKEAALLAPPLEWVFTISYDSSILSGVKKNVSVKNDGITVLSISPLIENVEWKRN